MVVVMGGSIVADAAGQARRHVDLLGEGKAVHPVVANRRGVGHGHLADQDPLQYIDEGINVVVKEVTFCRPAIHAALELGAGSFWEVIETLLTSTAIEFEVRLYPLFLEVGEQELHQWTRAMRRSICAALLDKSLSPDELRDEMRMLVTSYVNRITQDGQTMHSST